MRRSGVIRGMGTALSAHCLFRNRREAKYPRRRNKSPPPRSSLRRRPRMSAWLLLSMCSSRDPYCSRCFPSALLSLSGHALDFVVCDRPPASFLQSEPGLTAKEATERLAIVWKALSTEDKTPFAKQAAAAQKKYAFARTTQMCVTIARHFCPVVLPI